MPKESYASRAERHLNPLVKRLLSIVETKKSNLALSADLTTTKELLHIADTLGPYISILKTHIDLVKDFDNSTIQGLQALAEKHNFLFFEDRKFVDIGNTVQMQYQGALRIAEWAHFVNASILAGEGTVEGLREVGQCSSLKGQRGLLLLAEMSTKGSLATGEYTRKCIDLAWKYSDFVLGFVANGQLDASREGHDAVDFLTFTTGINRTTGGDSLGQRYQTPEEAIRRGSDIIIVGRGIYGALDPVESAKLYQTEAWEAYQQMLS